MRRLLAPTDLLTVSGGENTKARTQDAFSGRMDAGRGGLAIVSGRAQLTALPIVDATGRAHPQGWSQKDGVCRPTVIFALCLG